MPILFLSYFVRVMSRSSAQTVILLLTTICAVGCGSIANPPIAPGTPIANQNTTVTVLAASTANDRLLEFGIVITSIALTNRAGATVSLFHVDPGAPAFTPFVEFIHLNGSRQPIATVSIPQDYYVSASITVQYCSFTVTYGNSSGGLQTDTYAEGLCNQGTGTAIVNLPVSPIIVAGNAMSLSLDLKVPQSYTLTTPAAPGTLATYTISPTFDLIRFPISSQQTNDQNGGTSVDGEITSIAATGNTFDLTTPDGFTLTVNSGPGTVFQGVNAFSAVSVGMFADTDLQLQVDGSLLATRIAVQDTAAKEIIIGPLGGVFSSASVVYTLPVQHQGIYSVGFGEQFQYNSGTSFHTSGRFTNLPNLPFPATFDASNMVAGQYVYLSSSSMSSSGAVRSQANSITLMPQTINGTVTNRSTDGGFTIYDVSLAPYDLFPALVPVTGQSPVLSSADASNVHVYVDANTRLLTSVPIGIGSIIRFNGLLFNDNGVLRMDCGQINDGVQP